MSQYRSPYAGLRGKWRLRRKVSKNMRLMGGVIRIQCDDDWDLPMDKWLVSGVPYRRLVDMPRPQRRYVRWALSRTYERYAHEDWMKRRELERQGARAVRGAL